MLAISDWPPKKGKPISHGDRLCDWLASSRATKPQTKYQAPARIMLRGMRAAQSASEPDIVVEVVDIFVREAPVRIRAIGDALASGDRTTAAREAHTLKGSAGHLGAKTLATLCARFEDKVRAGAPFDEAFALEAIEEELARVVGALAGQAGEGSA